MARTSRKSIDNAPPQNSTEADLQDDIDVFDESDFTAFNEQGEKETIKRDARRKIEIYWEKRLLREQFEDLDESEIGF
ncbi:MAG: PA3496 family putative envelope integrity protein [Gammaproteobacteria bacterium]